MKTMKNYWAYLLVAVMSVCVTSCGDDDEVTVGSRELLVGTWETVGYYDAEYEDGELVYGSEDEPVTNVENTDVFQSDGTYINLYRGMESYRGTWSYSGNTLIIDDGEDVERWTVTTLDETTLIYECRESEVEDGITYTYYERMECRKVSSSVNE